ncbi:hypothetical protein BJ742DRAFT_737263 [Cladochytrium replicatum]|nr:hypothetical protein BJ742DRAFT_737263 [Cladochytrium replicatum]
MAHLLPGCGIALQKKDDEKAFVTGNLPFANSHCRQWDSEHVEFDLADHNELHQKHQVTTFGLLGDFLRRAVLWGNAWSIVDPPDEATIGNAPNADKSRRIPGDVLRLGRSFPTFPSPERSVQHVLLPTTPRMTLTQAAACENQEPEAETAEQAEAKAHTSSKAKKKVLASLSFDFEQIADDGMGCALWRIILINLVSLFDHFERILLRFGTCIVISLDEAKINVIPFQWNSRPWFNTGELKI